VPWLPFSTQPLPSPPAIADLFTNWYPRYLRRNTARRPPARHPFAVRKTVPELLSARTTINPRQPGTSIRAEKQSWLGSDFLSTIVFW
jgi:hypothetical protein